MKNQILSVLSQAVDTVLPARCVVTGDMVEKQGMVAPGAWASLDFIVRPFCDACGFPFDFETEGQALCGPCLTEHPPYESARAALRYNDASRSLGFRPATARPESPHPAQPALSHPTSPRRRAA